ncbi:MAG: hypothetical protein RMK19_05650 [Bacteroidia bacterium]|nr:DUF4397 domain-containing protein [Bacteroidia bacterium]MDW8015479.1 hypothetical protein [Bacteroidia bacterium]
MRNRKALLIAISLLTKAWAQQTAFVQVIHAVADVVGVSSPVVLDSIDIYVSLDGNTWDPDAIIPNFKFRQATPFIQVPANNPNVVIGVAPGNSTGPGDIILTETLPSFQPGSYNVLVAAGTLNPNPNLSIYPFLNARASAQNANQFEAIVFHGANDIATVDIYLLQTPSPYEPAGTLPQYDFISNYVPFDELNLIVLDSSRNDRNDFLPIGFIIPDPTDANLAGQTGVVFASGYVSTSDPRKAFGLHLALPNGIVFPLPTTEVRRMQLVHNAADPTLAQVNFTVEDIAEDPIPIDFRGALPTIFLPGITGDTLSLRFTTRSGQNLLAEIDFPLPPAGTNYVAFAQGVADTTRFAANPNGVSRNFKIQIVPDVDGWAPSNQFSVSLFHGVTDAPGVDVVSGNTTLAQNLKYLDYTAPISLPAGSEPVVEIRAAGQSTALVRYKLSAAQTQGGRGGVIFASGFLNPSANQNGPAFGLFIVYPDGAVQPLTLVTTLSSASTPQHIQVAGNPTLTGDWIVYVGTASADQIPYILTNLTGEVIYAGTFTSPSEGTWAYPLSFPHLPTGTYLLRIGEQVIRLLRL